MLNVLSAECMKLKRNKLVRVCTLIAFLLPLLMVLQEIYEYGGENPPDDVISWVFRLSLLFQVIVYPVLSGFILTFFLQKEYSDHTMINTLTAPVNRIKFLSGKIIIWAIWHVFITSIFLIIICMGAKTLYGKEIFSSFLSETILLIIKIGLFNLATLTPVIWITVLQRKTFYPSLLCTISFSAIGFAGLYWPKLIGSSVPWSAVVLISVPGMEVIGPLAYGSIGICMFIGLFLAIYSFKYQEL